MIFNQEALTKALAQLTENGFMPIVVETKDDALAKIKELIPKDASVMNGASTTLKEIGYIDYLKEGSHGWNNLHEGIVAEEDQAKQSQLRLEATISDYYTGSVHAFTQSGELLIASNSGSQLPHLAFTTPNVVLVTGVNKLVANLSEAFTRLTETVIPKEDERMKEVYGFGTTWAKSLVLHKENNALGRKVHIIIVKESLGF